MADALILTTNGSVPVFVSGGADVGPAGPAGPAGGVDNVATRSALAAISASAGMTRVLTETGREGLFVFNSANLSTYVTADTLQGVYVAPASAPTGASGAWVRQHDGILRPEWFGALGNDAALAGTDDSAAFAAAIALAPLIAKSDAANPSYKGGAKILLRGDAYYLGSTTLEVKNNITVEGMGNGISAANSTRLRWAANTTGIRVLDYNSAGASGEASPTHTTGQGTILRGMQLSGGYTLAGGEGEYHGIHARTRITVEDVNVCKFAGSGIHIVADTGSPPTIGNANNWQINRATITECRDGVYVAGGDTNGGTGVGIVAANNRRWGIFDNSFLGCTWIGPLAESNGLTPGNIVTVVTYGGNLYSVVYGQEANASTNAPSGTTADTAYWLYIQAGGAFAPANIVAWTSGMTVRAGGSFCAPNVNSRSVFIGAYIEGSQGQGQIWPQCLAIGGLATFNGPHIYSDQSKITADSYEGFKSKRLNIDEYGVFGSYVQASRFNAKNGIYQASLRIDPNKGIIDGWDGSAFIPYQWDAKDVVYRYNGAGTTLTLDTNGINLATGKNLRVNGTQVVGARGAALPADATDLATALTLVNAIKARMKATGGHGLVAD